MEDKQNLCFIEDDEYLIDEFIRFGVQEDVGHALQIIAVMDRTSRGSLSAVR